jgi:hypothetical protein
MRRHAAATAIDLRSAQRESLALEGGYCAATDASRATLTVCGPAGDVILRLRFSAGGARLELEQPDLTLSVAGRLQLEGETVAVRARRGDVELEANDDVRLRGERIRLN